MTPERRRQVEELYRAALEQPATDRLIWVAQQCADDSELRIAVETRLAHSKDTQLAAPPHDARSVAGRVQSGMSIGSYRVDKLLGAGGMGIVYRAIDTRLDRPVAIKFLAEGLLDAHASERFAHEARMASALNHPHILTVHDVGEYEGKPYIVAELVDGPTTPPYAAEVSSPRPAPPTAGSSKCGGHGRNSDAARPLILVSGSPAS